LRDDIFFGISYNEYGSRLGFMNRIFMHENHLYNLMSQMVEEHRSLWRIKTCYAKDAGKCAECKEFWKRMEKDKEAHIQELTDLLKKHM
jgi:hypothetical protein